MSQIRQPGPFTTYIRETTLVYSIFLQQWFLSNLYQPNLLLTIIEDLKKRRTQPLCPLVFLAQTWQEPVLVSKEQKALLLPSILQYVSAILVQARKPALTDEAFSFLRDMHELCLLSCTGLTQTQQYIASSLVFEDQVYIFNDPIKVARSD